VLTYGTEGNQPSFAYYSFSKNLEPVTYFLFLQEQVKDIIIIIIAVRNMQRFVSP